jgi:endoglucanase
VSHRAVFRAAPPHKRISPNLVGRVSAAFALAAVADARDHPRRARHELTKAKLLFARAATRHPPKQLVTALPHAFYPEDSWQDDMELGAAEIALASRRLGGQARPYVVASGHWARAYIRSRYGDTLNLYDTSALAHAALVNALSRTGMSGLAVSRADLMRDIQHQLETGVSRSRRDPFASGVIYDNFDANSHAFALVATAAIYHRLSGPHHSSYDRFATSWRNWLLGENPWGVAAMVGIGQTFPHCMQHQIANLEGSTDGSRPLDVGAVVNGPNDARIFAGGLGGYQDGMVHCPGTADPFKPFNGRGSRYVDDVRSWQTDEPALDMTGAAIIAAAEQLAAHRASR